MAEKRAEGQDDKASGPPSPELYVEIRKDGAPVDPAPWLRSAAALTAQTEVRGR
jgi:murein DD-endopeptidase MepM/ murein hydrolase activator NlpD